MKNRHVGDAKEWSLPRHEDLEFRLVEELLAKAPVTYFDRDHLGDELYSVFLDRLRELVGTAADEIIEYWLLGLADGHDGQFPEDCFEFPYVAASENVDALTIAYCVPNANGTRTQINRGTVTLALSRWMEQAPASSDSRLRARAMAKALRDLATTLEAWGARGI